jgi:hypothetical protein
MQVVTILNSHADTELTVNTIESIKRWVGNDLFVLIDGATWDSWGKDAPLNAPKLQGLYHNSAVSPHRNLTMALQQALKMWPNADWYCLTEYDTLFGNNSFKEDLEAADKRGVWMIGNDYRVEKYDLSFLEAMFKIKLPLTHYLLGCCVFLNAKFVKKLNEINFFNTFLNWTNPFEKGHIPYFKGYSFVEHLFPTLADYYGGKIEQFACWKGGMFNWIGNFKRYPMRFDPELDPIIECFKEMAIAHPIKDLTHPFRMMYKKKYV